MTLFSNVFHSALLYLDLIDIFISKNVLLNLRLSFLANVLSNLSNIFIFT